MSESTAVNPPCDTCGVETGMFRYLTPDMKTLCRECGDAVIEAMDKVPAAEVPGE